MNNKTDRFVVGQIVNTHGLRGDVKIKAFTSSPEDFEAFETLLVQGEGEKKFKIENVRYVKGLVLVKFEGIDDINAAERYKNRELYRLRADYGTLEEGEHFIVDLIGLDVIDEHQGHVGTIKDVSTNGAQNLYVVAREGKPDFYIPVVKAFVKKVSIEEGRVLVSLIEGMIE
ncbi:ribosome maturation factor RimM [Acidaminobacter hydrogenoformans]|uniref:Ribosome maturation factor RimM n=1 Tax=Acidaminobacter hydrogenoformans DSM 2784 TaxID=1120920 RepID=A0A1G5RSC4_9FIRM|nr:ribosome maturation factor RimM [Acidaminobacter hydrogenoformans]SCZ76896.1 16S rRNA processing protein RimM [Acidaminobacter hydrogenoformans DSM 2784]